MTATRRPDPLVTALAETRRLHGITQQQMAKRLCVSTQTVHFWERGHRIPGIDRVREYAVALDCDLGLVAHRTEVPSR